jgi:hypothetical protein
MPEIRALRTNEECLCDDQSWKMRGKVTKNQILYSAVAWSMAIYRQFQVLDEPGEKPSGFPWPSKS